MYSHPVCWCASWQHCNKTHVSRLNIDEAIDKCMMVITWCSWLDDWLARQISTISIHLVNNGGLVINIDPYPPSRPLSGGAIFRGGIWERLNTSLWWFSTIKKNNTKKTTHRYLFVGSDNKTIWLTAWLWYWSQGRRVRFGSAIVSI